MTVDITSLPPMLQLHPVVEHTYQGAPEHDGDRRNVVFGGQILAQMIMAANLDRTGERDDDKEVKSIHAIFAKRVQGGDPTREIVLRGGPEAGQDPQLHRRSDVPNQRQVMGARGLTE
jgi:acyl-CoA thioesterase